jgi:hypothetical protein
VPDAQVRFDGGEYVARLPLLGATTVSARVGAVDVPVA